MGALSPHPAPLREATFSHAVGERERRAAP